MVWLILINCIGVGAYCFWEHSRLGVLGARGLAARLAAACHFFLIWLIGGVSK